MSADDPLDAALGSLYDSVLRPEGWSLALHQLAQAVDAVGVVVFPPYAGDLSATFPRLPTSPELREPLATFVREGWWLNDHRAERARPLMLQGREVIVEHDVASDLDRRRLPVYHEFYRRFDVPWFAAAVFEAEGLSWTATFLRSASQGPFDLAGRTRIHALRPHIRRVVSLASRTSAIAGGAVVDLLNNLNLGAVLLDRRGVVTNVNSIARTLFGSGLDVAHGRLIADDPVANPRLQQLIQGATALPFSLSATHPVAIPRAAKRPVIIEAVPAMGLFDDPFSLLRAVLLLTDLGSISDFDAARLRAVFCLTNAEARLAVQLAVGKDLRAAAEILGITRQTARTQLKMIFSKTDTHRQSELVALLARLGAGRPGKAGPG